MSNDASEEGPNPCNPWRGATSRQCTNWKCLAPGGLVTTQRWRDTP
jgi:hypothetical protein